MWRWSTRYPPCGIADSEPLTLTELGESATFSKFYFSGYSDRSPGPLLAGSWPRSACTEPNSCCSRPRSASRTSRIRSAITASERSTSRFTRSVCFSPARYRSSSQAGMAALPPFTLSEAPQRFSTVRGMVAVPETELPVRIYVGAFLGPVVEGLPTACDILDSSGAYELPGVPDGTWFIRAAAVPLRDVETEPWDPAAAVRRVEPGGDTGRARCRERHPTAADVTRGPTGPAGAAGAGQHQTARTRVSAHAVPSTA